jgi:hypothetical protein
MPEPSASGENFAHSQVATKAKPIDSKIDTRQFMIGFVTKPFKVNLAFGFLGTNLNFFVPFMSVVPR